MDKEPSKMQFMNERGFDLLKRVLIIGAGPAGLACTRSLAESGIDVVLVEKSDRLGGILRRTRTVWPAGEDSEELLHRLYDELQDKLEVTVYLKTEPEDIENFPYGYVVRLSGGTKEEAGAVVIATGMRELRGNLFEFEYRWRDRGDFRGPLAFEVKEEVHPFLLETALWDAIMLHQQKPEEKIFFFFPEGVSVEPEFRTRAEKNGIELVRGRVPFGWLGAYVKLGKLVGNFPADLAARLGIPRDDDGYLGRPSTPGVFVVGAAGGPGPMEETINQAFATADQIRTYLLSKSKSKGGETDAQDGC
ncbi:FAD-dependent oxidoreductase [candidate division WOR-3 bacterium]|nr:FAD-dependent oxidoreductase [candidate division WOR-3 bacterium]